MLKLWLEDDKRDEAQYGSRPPRHRQIIFINSVAALACAPGYTAYNRMYYDVLKVEGHVLTCIQATKAAVRSLADTLRLEALRLSSPVSKYTVHCAWDDWTIAKTGVGDLGYDFGDLYAYCCLAGGEEAVGCVV